MSTSDGEMERAEGAATPPTTGADPGDAMVTDGSMTDEAILDELPDSSDRSTADGDLDWELEAPDEGFAWGESDAESLGTALRAGPATPVNAGAADLGEEPAGSYEGWWPEPSNTSDYVDAVARRPPHPARLALGVAVLAAERLRAGSAGEALATGVGLIESTAAQARRLARRISGPSRMAANWVGNLPGAGQRLRRSQKMVDRALADARRRGRASVAAGRAEAQAFLTGAVNDGLAWAQARAVPQIVDGLVPHLVDEVVPRLIDGALPEIRARVLPVLIDDLTNDPQVRDLILEQGRSAVRDAAHHLRSSSANADTRVESAYRKMFRGNGSE